MKRFGRVFVVTFALLMAWTLPAFAQQQRYKVAVLPVSGVNIHEGYLEATGDFLRVHLESTGRYQVIMIEGASGPREVNAQDAVAAARQVGATMAIVVHVARLGSTARVRLVAYDAGNGALIHTDELAAGSPDDVDPVLARLAKGLATGRRAADSGDIETVTEREADPLLKRAATNVFGLKIGVILPVTRAGEGETGLPGMGLFWLYDVRSFLAEVAVDFHFKDDNGDFTVGLGAYYPFSRENTTPYLGAGLRYGTASLGDDGGTGVSLDLTAGVLIGRLSTVQVRGEVKYFLNTFNAENRDTGAKTRESGIVVNAGIGF